VKDVVFRGPVVSAEEAEIYEWFGFTDYISEPRLSKALKDAGDEGVRLLVNSPGGDMTVGTQLYSVLSRYGKAEALVEGIAASAATLAICGCTVIRAEPGAMFCFHNPTSYAEGDHSDMSSAAETLREAKAAILDLYMRRAKVSRRELSALMDRDVLISAKTAMYYGLCDEINGGEADGEPAEDVSSGSAPADSGYDIRLCASLAPAFPLTNNMRELYAAHIKEEREKKEALDAALARLKAVRG
jgi:ATP-dependent Clp protease protease subunit